jgi:predicted enzyme related to lactoylglutathione lyase
MPFDVHSHHEHLLTFKNESKMNPVVHFELPANDRKRMADFYTSVFGWQAKMWGEEMGNYVTVATTEIDEKGMPKRPGAINGGLYPIMDGMEAQHPSVVIAVDDIREAMKKIEGGGGKIMGEPVDISGVGQYVSFVDTEGNRLSILQPKME